MPQPTNGETGSADPARHRDQHGELHEYDRPDGDDHDYQYAGALSKWHDEQLQAIDGTDCSIEEDFDQLEKRPDPPEALPDDAIPICATLLCGDVQWVEANAPDDPDFHDLKPGSPDIIFDALTRINRFAFHKFEGGDCIVGWVYTTPVQYERTNTIRDRAKVYIRTDVLERYGDPDNCDYYKSETYWVRNPRAYGDHYTIYKDL